ncbi:hypothetical protein [Massilia endophytica]|uniref:hypothetical protein n=1 Tax=Massilia endophytica TaxID=2899220 RepID=UPI001E3D1646|nr:hypothetical protein [Massilia endophytica]UGQ45948.1 hypothetical protein LSQ66_19505 [Massilia endophytica]
MFPIASLAVNPDTLFHLMSHLRDTRSALNPAEAAELALQDWLTAQRTANSGAGTPRGYRWKQLFLPEGSKLRIWLHHEHSYAEVVGDELIYQGCPTSPNRFISCCESTHRNAWELIGVLLPGERVWKPAVVLRRQAAREAKAAAEQTTEAAPPPKPVPQTPVQATVEWAAPQQQCWGERRAWHVPGRRVGDMMPGEACLDG